MGAPRPFAPSVLRACARRSAQTRGGRFLTIRPSMRTSCPDESAAHLHEHASRGIGQYWRSAVKVHADIVVMIVTIVIARITPSVDARSRRCSCRLHGDDHDRNGTERRLYSLSVLNEPCQNVPNAILQLEHYGCHSLADLLVP